SSCLRSKMRIRLPSGVAISVSAMLAIDESDVLAPTRRLPLEEMRESLAELQSMRAMIDEQIDALKRLLDTVTDGRSSYPRKRDAVLALLEERVGGEMPLAQIRAHLIARGEIPDTPKAAHALQMTLSTLAREGLVERVKQGIYRLEAPGSGDRLRAALAPYQGGLFNELADPTSGTTEAVRQGEGETS